MNLNEKVEKIKNHINKYPDSAISFLNEAEVKELAGISVFFALHKKKESKDPELEGSDTAHEKNILIDYGDQSHDMLIILEGDAVAYGTGETYANKYKSTIRARKLSTSIFNSFSSGDVVGEFRYLNFSDDNFPRSAKVKMVSKQIEFLRIQSDLKDKGDNLGKEKFLQILLGNPAMAKHFFSLFSTKSWILTEKVNQSRFLNSMNKLCMFLIDQEPEMCKEKERVIFKMAFPGKPKEAYPTRTIARSKAREKGIQNIESLDIEKINYQYEIRLDQLKDILARINVSEKVYAELRKLKKKGYVATFRDEFYHIYVLDKNALKTIMEKGL